MGRTVSVIMPVYNKEKYIARSIKSICSQTYSNLEIILVNDGSTDGSDKICKQMATQDARIIYTSQKNSGPSAARNRGLDLATGTYITFLDADDTLVSFAIEKMVDCIQECHADIVVARQKVISDADIYITGDAHLQTGVLTEGMFFESLAADTIGVFWGSQGNKLYTRKNIAAYNLRFENERYHAEDFLFNLSYFKSSPKIAFLNQVTCEIYDVPKSLSKQTDVQSLAIWGEDVWRSLHDFYTENHQEELLPYVDAVFCKIVRGAITQQYRSGELSLKIAHLIVIYYARVPWIATCIKTAKSTSIRQQIAIHCFRIKAYWILAALYYASKG